MNFACQILKPAFTIVRDKESKCLVVFIRGTRSIKDTLTDALCAPVSFDHFICSDGGKHERNNMVSGHAHRGMVAAADWIWKRCIPELLKALHQNPHFKIKVSINVMQCVLLIKTMHFSVTIIITNIFPYRSLDTR